VSPETWAVLVAVAMVVGDEMDPEKMRRVKALPGVAPMAVTA
jgi:hypothetical protein